MSFGNLIAQRRPQCHDVGSMRQQFSATGRQLVILHQNHLAFTAFQCDMEAPLGADANGVLSDWGLALSGDLPPKAEKLQSWTRKLVVHGVLVQLADLAFVGRSAPKAA